MRARMLLARRERPPVPSALRIRLGFVPELSAVATAPSARFALPSDRHYLAGRHVWAQIENGIATVGVTAPLGEVLWYTPEIEYWAVDRVEVGETLATVQGRSSRAPRARSRPGSGR